MCPSPCSRVSHQVKECVMLAIFLDLTVNPGYTLLTKTLSEPAALWSLHRYTHSKKYLISGSDNGIVRVQEAPVPGQLQMAEKSKYWEVKSACNQLLNFVWILPCAAHAINVYIYIMGTLDSSRDNYVSVFWYWNLLEYYCSCPFHFLFFLEFNYSQKQLKVV
jgi:hypothetical protein